MRTSPSLTALSASLLLALGACGSTDSGDADESEPSVRTETSSPQPRVLVASDEGVAVVDGETLETIEEFETDGRAKLGVAGDDRHVFTMQYDAGVVGVVDSGTWSDAHGSHAHSYVTEPRELDTEFPGGTSYHVVSDGERSVVWFDTDGSFEVFDWKGLEDDSVDVQTIELGTPHHGVAAPLSNGGFLATIAEDDSPIGVAVLDEDGEEIERIESCPGLHGEAHLDGDTYAFGCATGMLMVEDGSTGVTIASPRDGAGSGSLAAAEGSSVVVGDLYAEGDDEAATRLAFYDVEDRSATEIDLGLEFSSLGRDGSNTVALGTDGALHVLDENGEEIAHHEVIAAWETFDDWQEPVPSFALGDGVAYVTDPRDNSIRTIDLETGDELASGSLEHVPASLVVTNAG